MAYTNALSLVPRTFRSVPFVELKQPLPSQVAVISPFVDQLMRFIARFRAVDGSEVDIDIALREALTNAVVHGNHESPDKHVEVVCRCSADGEVSITIRDEGNGFDVSAIPDPTSAANQMSNHGRGIYLMQVMIDEVSFEEGGRVVHLRKKPNLAWPLR